MNKKIIGVFKCPQCRTRLEFKEAAKQEGDAIIDGQVMCPNGHKYKIENKVLKLFKG